MQLDDVTFIDLEADRAERPLALGWVRGAAQGTVSLRGRGGRPAELAGLGPIVAGHNLRGFDWPLLEQRGLLPPATLIIDTLPVSLLADPLRVSHALDKPHRAPGAVPDPVGDARESRDRLRASLTALRELEPSVLSWYVAAFAAGGEPGLRWCLDGPNAPPPASLAELTEALPEALLERFCRVRLPALIATLSPARPREALALALAVRFIEVARSPEPAAQGRLSTAPSAALALLPRFGELVARLMGPLCPDRHCPHRRRCEVHRPHAEEILADVFELPAFRPNQQAIVEAVLDGETPLVLLPTGGGKSLCYQVPAVHGAQRLRGLTVVVSPLQALMADQVRSLERRYTGTCLVNSSLLQEVRRRHLQGARTGQYDIVYLGPEQLRNPSIVRLLSRRPPFLWVVDEAHCISQWGHGFRTDYTYLPRAIAAIHAGVHRPLIALFTATATHEVVADIQRQVEQGLGVTPRLMDFDAPRRNLEYEVLQVADETQKEAELLSLLAAHPDGSRLVYAATVRGVCELAERLRAQGIPCIHYHGKLAPNEKRAELERFLSGAVNTVVATSAFGMGIDKPDIRLVVHHDLPGSVEDYVQETGRAGRDGAPARCALLFCEADLETQFFLKLAGLVTEREVRVVFLALRRRARALRPGPDGRVELWVSPEDLFVEEELDEVLDWSREGLHGKVKLVLYHLEADGVLERQENRTRTFSLDPLLPTLEAALAKLPANKSPATERVLRYVYAPERPRELSILDVADEAGLTPAEAFRELGRLQDLGIVGQDLRLEITFARQVPNDTARRTALLFGALDALFASNEDLEAAPVVGLRAASAELGRRGVPCAPHELYAALRTLRNLGWLRLDKAGPGRYRVAAAEGIEALRWRVRDLGAAARALVAWADERLKGRTGRDLALELDVAAFVEEQRGLFTGRAPPPASRDRGASPDAGAPAQGVLFAAEAVAPPRRGRAAVAPEPDRLYAGYRREEVVEAALALHHFEAWHLADPPVLFDIALKVRFDPRRLVESLDLQRPSRQRKHEISLVHLLREYAVRPSDERRRYLDDYFHLPRAELVERYFAGRRRAIERPVSAATEAAVLAGLTAAQREVVMAEDPALLVVAGPGSGKTHTIVRRVAHMIRARQLRGSDILVLAFSRSAARELRERLLSEVGRRARGVRVRTFHGLALELTGEDVREEGADAEARLAGVVARAAALLREGGDDGEHHREAVLGSVRHVLVDEYQDLDADQYDLLTELVGLVRGEVPRGRARVERSVVVVGDDDQAIFGFRKASVEFLRRFEAEFGARRVCLAECFRSRPGIVAAASAFIDGVGQRLKLDPQEQLRAVRVDAAGAGPAVRRFRYATPTQLAAHVALGTARELAAGTTRLGVLARSWAALDPIRGALEAAGVSYCLSHRDHHRPLHRRHPTDRILQALYRAGGACEGSARKEIESLLAAAGRAEDDPVGAELVQLATDIDEELLPLSPAPLRHAERADERSAPLRRAELADRLLLASRDADRRVVSAPVWLGTFHGAKGLEFDKVVILPCVRDPRSDPDEEVRLYYVAMTRARDELLLTTYGGDDLAARVAAPEVDVRPHDAKLTGPLVAYLDATPRDVVLRSEALGRAQGRVSFLREGAPLTLVDEGTRVVLLAPPEPAAPGRSVRGGDGAGGRSSSFVGELSGRGVRLFRDFADRGDVTLTARVHEVFVHLTRDQAGQVERRSLVVLPTFVAKADRGPSRAR